MKTASKNYRKNQTNTNARKLKTTQYQLAGTYIKEQTECIQNQIDKIRDSVEDRQSRIARQTINEVSRRKSTAKAKLKAANQRERIKLWKQHFENLLGNPPKVTHEPITRRISKQLESLTAYGQKNLQATLLFIDFTKAFDSIHRGKMEQILLAYGLSKETVAAITILYRNTKVNVRSPGGIFRNCVVGHECVTLTTLSRRLTMPLSDTSSIAQHLKKTFITDNTTILEHQNNKQKLLILEALHIRNMQPTLNRINFQTSANVLKYLELLTLIIETHLKANAIIFNGKDAFT